MLKTENKVLADVLVPCYTGTDKIKLLISSTHISNKLSLNDCNYISTNANGYAITNGTVPLIDRFKMPPSHSVS